MLIRINKIYLVVYIVMFVEILFFIVFVIALKKTINEEIER